MIVMLQSCGLVYDDVEKNQNPETDSYLLSIQLYTGQPLSRASDDIVAAEGNEAESYIDFEGNDYRVILFDSKGEYITQLLPDNLRSRESDQTKYIHKLWFEIPHGQGFSLPQDISKLPLYVIVLTNWQKWVDQYPDYTGKTLADLWEDGGNYNFTYPYLSQGGELTWMPNSSQKQLIPMFGIGIINNFNYDLSQKKNIGNTTVNLIRALAKIEIEVSDELYDNGSNTRFNVEECIITKINNIGRFFPNVTEQGGVDEFIIKTDVSRPSIPSSNVWERNNLKFRNISTSGKNLYVAYVPEMATGLLTLNTQTRPQLNVSISCNNSAVTGWTFNTKYLELAKYQDGEPVGEGVNRNLFHILRNHVYSYKIQDIKVNEFKIITQYTVCEWVTYDDINIGFD